MLVLTISDGFPRRRTSSLERFGEGRVEVNKPALLQPHLVEFLRFYIGNVGHCIQGEALLYLRNLCS